jgi:hypothetical protein
MQALGSSDSPESQVGSSSILVSVSRDAQSPEPFPLFE